jgi:hypothetical protein
MSGIGPGTGVADAGAIVCCADAVPTAAAAIIAATHMPRVNPLVSNMAFPPLAVIAGPAPLDTPPCRCTLVRLRFQNVLQQRYLRMAMR